MAKQEFDFDVSCLINSAKANYLKNWPGFLARISEQEFHTV